MDNKELATKSAATVVDDLLFEIILRLPSQSIQRFITACKQWQSLITLPTFRKLWCKRNLKPSTGIFVRYRTRSSTSQSYTYLVPFSPNKPTTRSLTRLGKDVTIVQSCNGLLLCSTGDFKRSVYYVYNPTTDTYHTLPRVNDYVETRISLALAFDPNKSPHYKVINFIGDRPCVYVYSSDTHCWKLVSKSSTYGLNNSLITCLISSRRRFYWNGAIHWMYCYFDVENEKFKRTPTPPGIYYYFGESCERLICATLCKSRGYSCSSAYVYELKRDYSGWVSKHRVELDDMYSTILSVVYGVEDDDSFLVLKKGDKIVRYNLLSKTSEELNLPMAGDYVKEYAFQYIESLCGV